MNEGSSIVAVLGPTNTGKTHRAVERMLEHPTGMIGLPLRLLAREVYDRVSARERTWDVLETVQDVAEARGASMPQVALAWLLARPAVSSVILGARTTGQLRSNLGAADLVLEAEEVTRLDEVSDPGAADYPYGDVGGEQRSRDLSGTR